RVIELPREPFGRRRLAPPRPLDAHGELPAAAGFCRSGHALSINPLSRKRERGHLARWVGCWAADRTKGSGLKFERLLPSALVMRDLTRRSVCAISANRQGLSRCSSATAALYSVKDLGQVSA